MPQVYNYRRETLWVLPCGRSAASPLCTSAKTAKTATMTISGLADTDSIAAKKSSARPDPGAIQTCQRCAHVASETACRHATARVA